MPTSVSAPRTSTSPRPEAPRDCPLCPRLVAFRGVNRSAEPDWFNAPVPSFGDASGRLLIVGLAPGLKGANRTGRPFTGDHAGVLLYETLLAFGFAEGRYDARPDDGLSLIDCMITNAVRCVPPQNKPLPDEITACRRYFTARVGAMPKLRAMVALGRVAHDQVLAALGLRKALFPFAHGARHEIGPALTMIDSLHCSRLNTNTGRLTPEMFARVFQTARDVLGSAPTRRGRKV